MGKKKTYIKPEVTIIRLDREFADTTVGMATSENASSDYEVLSRQGGTFFDDEEFEEDDK